MEKLWYLLAINMRPIFMVISMFLVNGVQCADDCYCGFGGVCRFHPDTQKNTPTDCTKCESVSKGLYKNCHELINHCDSEPCRNGGSCFMTFGGFFCRCPPTFYGHTCENRRTKRETFEVVSGPRVWYQVNRVWGGLTQENQFLHFSVESPGDGMVVQVRFEDGRMVTIMDTDLRLSNEKQKCIEEHKMWPTSTDPNICETLPNAVVYSTTIDLAFFEDKFLDEQNYETVTVEIQGKNVTEGRLDDIHITIMNWKRITYSHYYRIHTAFDIWPKCLYKIDFFGCSVDSKTPIVHESEQSIYLKSIRIPTNNCSVGRIKKMKWYMVKRGNQPFLSRPDKEEVYLDGSDLMAGKHFIDFLMLVEGRPPYHGHPDLSYNYGRCWIKIVHGEFKVGLEGGNSRAAPCIKPLSLRIFSYNSNYKEKNFASIWKCNYKGLELCERQRFLGPTILFRTLPCGSTIVFKAMVVDVPTGSKTFLTATVKTTVHVDSLCCSCTYNCYPTINPRSSTKMKVEVLRLSTATGSSRIKWQATFADEPWGIERFIVPETQETAIEIPPHTFERLTEEQIAHPTLQITASKHDLYCTISVDVTIPMKTPSVGWSVEPKYIEEINDERFKVFILEHPVLNNKLPLSYVLSEKITPNSTDKEVVEFILGDVQQFIVAKLQNPAYVTCLNHMGVPSHEFSIPTQIEGLKPRNQVAIEGTIELIRKLALTGHDNLALTEMLFVSRSIATSERQKYKDKMEIMEIMNYVTTGFDRSASNLVVSAKLNKALNTMNRLMLISNLMETPFNVSIYPWKIPKEANQIDIVKNWVNMYLMAAETLHSVTNYYYSFVSKRLTTPNNADILKLIFESLLRLQLAKSSMNDILPKLDDYPTLRFKKRADAVEMTIFMQKAIVLLLKSMDFHIDGHTGHLSFSIGTSTASGFVLPAYSAPEWSRLVLNDYQHVRISVKINDPTIEETDSLYLGVFVEVPLQTQLTALVHVHLLTHLTQRRVAGIIDVQLNVSRRRNPDLVKMLGTAQSSKMRPVTVFKLVLDSEPDVINSEMVRQVNIHFESNASLRVVLRSYVPEYIDVVHTPSTRNPDHVQIVAYNDAFLGVLPGKDEPPLIPISFQIDMMQFICIQISYDNPTEVESLDTKSVCKMVSAAKPDNKLVTCSCSGSGLIQTYSLALRAKKILVDFENNNRSGRFEDLKNADYNFFLLAYPLLLLFMIILAWRRDKKSWKREFIQQLADTFPGDEFAYIVCVCTGTKTLAGTDAHVGIQIFGTISASRVHILHSRSYKVLGWGQDDWFVVFTPERLGKLIHLVMWQDYVKPCPGWYCSHVLVYDVEHQTWYKFIVEKWLDISNNIDKSRITVVRSRKYIPEKDLGVRFTFREHYWRELRNTHSLMSPFTKHRRFVHSYRMRACLTSTFVLTLVSTVIIVDYYLKKIGTGLYYDNIFVVAFISTVIASVPYTFATFFFTRSVVKMRKTKTLDLNWVEHMRPFWDYEQDEQWMGREKPAYSMHHIEDLDWATKQIELHEKKRKISKKRERPKKGSQFSNHSFSLSVHKWMPSSIYRPIRVDDYGQKPKGMGPYVCGWIIVTVTVLANLAFLIYWLSRLGWLQGRNGPVIVAVALIIEAIRSSLVVLFLSCYTVYSRKRCNFEINCLDLVGLRNDAKIVDHLRFLEATTKPYYHPLKKHAVVALYKKKVRKLACIRLFAFVFLCIGMILPTVVLNMMKDTQNIYRVNKGVIDVYKEPILNNFTNKLMLFKDVRTRDDITNYVWATILPAGRVSRWYNRKPMRPKNYFNDKEKQIWFIDRSSKLRSLSRVRILQATNNSKVYLNKSFKKLRLPMFEVVYGHLDKFAKYKTTYNRWHQEIKKEKSTVITDIILSDGVTGKTGIFYPTSIGDEMILQKVVKRKDEGINHAMKKLATRNSRAIIVEVSLIHPLFSQTHYNPMFGYTVLQLLFENCASGIYSGSIKTSFFYAKSFNYLRLGLIFIILFIICIFPVCLKLSYDGLKSCFKQLLYWVLLLGSISCFTASATQLGIHFYIEVKRREPGLYEMDNVDYHKIVWLDDLSQASIGCFLLMGTMAWTVWWAGLTGMIKRSVESNVKSFVAVFVIYLTLTFCVGSVYNNEFHNREMLFERINKSSYYFQAPKWITVTFIIFSRAILWPLQIGVVMHVTLTYINNVHTQTNGTDKTFNAAHYIEHLKKKWSGETAEENESDRSREAILNQVRDEKPPTPRQSASVSSEDPAHSPTARLDNKFNLWK